MEEVIEKNLTLPSKHSFFFNCGVLMMSATWTTGVSIPFNGRLGYMSEVLLS